MADRTVELYFDLISPYSWLALTEVEAFGLRHSVTWDVRPVVYAALLDAHGLVGPAEAEAKRRYTFHDVARRAARLGLRFEGPPAHPFRSLEALRLVTAHRGDGRALTLAVRLAASCWEEGADLTDPGVLARAAREAGLDDTALETRIATPEVKAALRATTDEALRAGVFGVPTFRVAGETFWGHDRMDDLAAFLEGRLPAVAAAAERMLARPRAVERRRRP